MNMVKIKVNEATVPQLNWLVASIEIPPDARDGRPQHGLHPNNHSIVRVVSHFYGSHPDGFRVYTPATDFATGMPIIHRENISLERPVMMRGCAVVGFHDWRATHPKNYGGLCRYHGSGETMLIAGLRCFVASRLGDEAMVPAVMVEAK
jgi:hypothetical protein